MDLEEARAAWHRATEKDRPTDAIKALVHLERYEPKEPRWPHRLGEAYRRTNQTKEAVDAFARAFERYVSLGFLPRAIAMAKLVGALDPARADLLERLLPQRSGPPPLPAAIKPPPLPSPAATKAAPPPLPPDGKRPPPLPVRAAPPPPPPPPPAPPMPATVSSVPPPRVVKPAPLERAHDSSVDEVRFRDEPESSIDFVLTDFSSVDVVIENDLDLDDDGPPTKPVDPMAVTPPTGAFEATAATRVMASVRLFASLSAEALVALANVTELVEFVPTAMIIVRDEKAFALYIIVSGSARVIVPGNPEIGLREGDVFGEGVLLDEGIRQADVRATTPLMTLRVDKKALEPVMKEFPEVEHALFDLLARRLVTNLMHTSPLFMPFEPAVRLELAQRFEVRRASPGTVIAEHGRRSDGLYILLAGHVTATPQSGGSPTRIARGTPFGHASLLGGASDVTVRAVSEAVLLRMPAADFASLAASYPPVLAQLAETASDPLPTSRRDV